MKDTFLGSVPNAPWWVALLRFIWMRKVVANVAHRWFAIEGYTCVYKYHHWHCVIRRLRVAGYRMSPFTPRDEVLPEALWKTWEL